MQIFKSKKMLQILFRSIKKQIGKIDYDHFKENHSKSC